MTKPLPKWKKIALFFAVGFVVIAAIGGIKRGASSLFYPPEVVTFEKESLQEMNSAVFDQELEAAANKPVLILIYASWCPYCKKQIEILKSLQKRYTEEEVKVLYISIDNDRFDLSQFLVETQGVYNITPYHVAMFDQYKFKEMLTERYGAQEMQGVPKTLILDQKRKLVADLPGLHSITDILEPLKKALFAQ